MQTLGSVMKTSQKLVLFFLHGKICCQSSIRLRWWHLQNLNWRFRAVLRGCVVNRRPHKTMVRLTKISTERRYGDRLTNVISKYIVFLIPSGGAPESTLSATIRICFAVHRYTVVHITSGGVNHGSHLLKWKSVVRCLTVSKQQDVSTRLISTRKECET